MFLKGKVGRLHRILGKITKISKSPLKAKNSDKMEIKLKKLHLIVSSLLFGAARNHNYKIIDIIIKNDFVRADLVAEENGLNILQYSLVRNDTELFKLLFSKYYNYIKCYFDNCQSLFMLVLNKKNFELIEFFLTTPVLFKQLRKENISLCLYLLIKSGKDKLLSSLLSNPEIQELLDGRDIQSLLIYFIVNNNLDKIQKICSFRVIITKCSDIYLKNLIALSIMNNNIKALEILLESTDMLKVILSDNTILKNVVLFAYNNCNLSILSKISKNKTTCNIVAGSKTNKAKVPKNVISLRKTAKLVEDSI